MRIVAPEDCGNAPRKVVLRDLTAALAIGDLEAASEFIDGKTEWEVVGGPRLAGPHAVCGHFEKLTGGAPCELRIRQIITHGRTAALNYALTCEHGAHFECCDVYLFRGSAKHAKVKEVASYVIRL